MTKEVLVIREKDVFSSLLIEQGFAATNLPTVKTAPLVDLSELENRLLKLETFDGIFVTSLAAAEIVAAKLNEMRKTFDGRFFVLGRRSADLLKAAGCNVFFSLKASTAAELLGLIPKEDLRNKRFLFVRGNRSLRTIPETLKGLAEVAETAVYQTIEAETDERKLVDIKEKFAGGKIIAVCFFSPSGVEGFLDKFENFSQHDIKVAAIGKTTAHFAESKNLRVDLVSASPSAEKFAAELIDYLRKIN